MRTRNERAAALKPDRTGASVLALLCFLLTFLFALPSLAGPESPFSFDDGLPPRFQYDEAHEVRPPSVSFRRNESRAVEAPTRYRTSSILKYSTPLGDSGMIFRVKLPLNPRKIIKLELRF